jgi:hypothetical protein
MWHQMGSSPRTSVKTYQGIRAPFNGLAERHRGLPSDPLGASAAIKHGASAASGAIQLQRLAAPYLVLGSDRTAQRYDDQDQRQNGTDGHHGPLSFGLD